MIQGSTSVVSGSFQPQNLVVAAKTDFVYDRTRFEKSSGMGMLSVPAKSHDNPPRCTTWALMSRHASYISSAGTRSYDELSDAPMCTPLSTRVWEIARVPECPRPMTIVRDMSRIVVGCMNACKDIRAFSCSEE